VSNVQWPEGTEGELSTGVDMVSRGEECVVMKGAGGEECVVCSV